MGQPRHASWSSLPAPLAERIVRQAFENSGRAVLQWLRLSLVCRCEYRQRADAQITQLPAQACSSW